MADNPFKAPQASVEDNQPIRAAKWGRSAWLHLPVFGLLSIMGVFLLLENPSAFSFSSVGIGVALSALFLFRPLKSLVTLSEEPIPWYWDLLYYLTVGVGIFGALTEDVWLFVAMCLPAHLINGAFGFCALAIERTRKVRVYTSARRWLFEGISNAT